MTLPPLTIPLLAAAGHPDAVRQWGFGLLLVLGLVLLVIAAAVAVRASRVPASLDELTRIRSDYASLIVPVAYPPAGPKVETKTFEDLAEIAETDNRVIHQLSDATGTTFYVDYGRTVYRYRVAAEGPLPGGEYRLTAG